jgi:hypothetical protein
MGIVTAKPQDVEFVSHGRIEIVSTHESIIHTDSFGYSKSNPRI